MKQEINEYDMMDEVDDVPVSPLLSLEKKNRYGSVPGLDDEELADPEELERQVYIEMFGPVLRLPIKRKHSWIRPNIDEEGIDWGAFGTVDFSRLMPEFDKPRYKAEKLAEERENVVLMYNIIRERLPGTAKNKVLKYLDRGVIELDQIANEDMRMLGQLFLRAEKLRQEIYELKKASWERREAKRNRWMASLA
jgi:hypothetical protein